ncbi:MAG: bacteriohemerythrin [Terriglobales bacterium]
MALVTWDQSYSVSVKRLDEQHQKLFALINSLHEAMRQGKGQVVVQDTVRELAAYTATHFRAEEQLLRNANYPGLIAHQAEHQRYVAKVNQFAEDVKAGKLASSIAVLSFLKDWLAEHIKRTDGSYAAHLNAHGVR